MCPLCVANMALVAAGTTSSGGLAALALSKFHRRKGTNQVRGTKNETARNGIQNKDETDGSSGSPCRKLSGSLRAKICSREKKNSLVSGTH